MKPRILVVDDEKNLRDFVRHNLEARGYQVLAAASGLEALAVFERENVDLVILDVMMPHLDGLETTRRIRARSYVPIIILTALGEEEDKVRAFDLGADDYLTKPFGVGELLGRVKAALRRAQWSEIPPPSGVETHLTEGEISLNLENHLLTVRGQSVELTPIEFKLIAYLMQHRGKSLSHSEILRHVWGEAYRDEVEYLRVYIGRLRQRLERDPLRPEYLHTERGYGYRFGK